jgi:predicted nucleic acid-binding protein
MSRCSVDANIVIDILDGNANGHRTPEEWDGILELLDDLDKKRIVLVAPSALFVELLPAHHRPEAITRLFHVLQRDNVEVVDLTVPVARRVAEIRQRSIANGSKLHTMDAIYVATADFGNVDVLYTVDKKILSNDGRLGVKTRFRKPMGRSISLFPFDWS